MFAFVHSRGCAPVGVGNIPSAKLNVLQPTSGRAARASAAMAVTCSPLHSSWFGVVDDWLWVWADRMHKQRNLRLNRKLSHGHRMTKERFRVSIVPSLLLLVLPLGLAPVRAEVQLRCEGTLLEARGSAEQERPIKRLRFSLGLEAEQRTSDAALALVQARLAAVRVALQNLEVRDLRVTSPSTWQRPAERGQPPLSQASLQVGGTLAPPRLQALIRQVGTLPGVRLAPVTPEAEPVLGSEARRALLTAAYQRALSEARELASAIGLSQLRPLELQVEGDSGVVPLRAMAAKADAPPPPFDPAELPPPKATASMLVRFCAR